MEDRPSVGDDLEREIPFQHLAAEVWSQMEEPTALTVRTRSAWEDLWRRATANRQTPANAPQVDWSTDWVLFVATGTRPSTGYRVEIRRLVRRGHTIHVYAVEILPPHRAVTGCALTHPLHAVTTPREPDGVTFQFHFQREIPEQ
jgi:hypothetical protein